MKSLLSYIGIFGLFLVIFTSCEDSNFEPFEYYTINKGAHGSTPKVELLQSKELNFKAIFNESAIYTSSIPENQHDINKLLGFSDCNTQHHQNSARIGWRWLDGKLEIFAYCYVNGERITQYLGETALHEARTYSIVITKEQYVFEMEGYDQVVIPRSNVCDSGVFYMLFPYFGGDEKAPHDIDIGILRLY